MSKKGLQLYSVREELALDFEGTVAKIAEMGYDGVETAGLPEGIDYKQAKEIFNRYNLEVASAFTSLAIGDDAQLVLDIAKDLGCKRIISGKGADDFTTVEDIKKNCEEFNIAHKFLKKHDLQLLIHNHAFEFNMVDGRLAYEIMLDYLDVDVALELDAYWVAVGGSDPVELIKKYENRIPQIHVKDGPCEDNKPMMPLGKGKLDLVNIVKVAKNCDWIMVELDSCDSPMIDAIKESIDYLAKI